MSCNGNCNQGRTCNCGSNEMNDTQFIMLLAICIVIYAVIGWGIIKYTSRNVTMNYDCRIAEISPDVPVVVKEQCHKKMEK
jgi:hypothetical protein